MSRFWLLAAFAVLFLTLGPLRSQGRGDDVEEDDATEPRVDSNVASSKQGSKTDDEVVAREEEAIKLDGLNVAQIKEMREKAEKHAFQAEVDRMMKLIINSLYKNKEIFLRELISNASDALDKIRIMSLTDKAVLETGEELSIKIKADKEGHVLHITDTGVGMTKEELIKNLGTLARSGTNEFFQKISESSTSEASDLIGQFGVGFYSAFLVADRVVVTSKSNSDNQYIWESDAASFSIVEDPRGDTLKRGTTISLHLKEEAFDYLEENTLKDLVKKYSQFINFPIYLWSSKTETIEEPIDEEEPVPTETKEEDEEGKVEEAPESKEDKPKTKKVEKTIWDWTLMNELKPIWTRKPADVKEAEYNEFYKAFSKDSEDALAHIHFSAEGEVSFKSILFIPKRSPTDLFSKYGAKTENIKLYVRRVFITDDFQDIIPKYLSFIRGVVDSDDLPLNVSRETLQQNKLIKLIRKKIVRKVLDMIKKMDKDTADKFRKEYSTNLKLGVIEDSANRSRLAKLLRFQSSNSKEELTNLADYVKRMKTKQENIFYMAAATREEAEQSPFVERLLQKGFEVLYLTEPVDEYCMQSMPEFEGKKFQNAAKEGIKIGNSDKHKKVMEELQKQFEPLTKWLQDKVLSDKIEKAVISERLTQSPCALVAKSYGWTGNMERIMKAQAYAKAKDPTQDFYASQKKTLELNPGHPVIKDLLRRVEADEDDEVAKDLALVLYETSAIRSGYSVPDTVGFMERVEKMLRRGLNIAAEEKVQEIDELADDSGSPEPSENNDENDAEDAEAADIVKDEL